MMCFLKSFQICSSSFLWSVLAPVANECCEGRPMYAVSFFVKFSFLITLSICNFAN